MSIKKASWGVLASAIACATLSTTSTARALPSNNELKIGITQEFENFNPLIQSMSATVYMSNLSIRQFVILSPDAKWVTQLAKSIPSLENGGAKIVTENGQKNLVATWEIIPNAKWGDGKDMTCEDLQFSWQLGLNQNISISTRDGFENIKKIAWENSNPKKCVVTYNKIKWSFYQEMPYLMPKHIEEAVFKKYGNKSQGYDQNSEYNKNPTNPGLYNGPYVVSELKLGSHVTFTANKYFYGKQPSIKKVIFKLIPNTGTLEANLRSGTIDMVSPIGFEFDQALAFEKRIKADNLPYNMNFKPGVTYEHIDLNLSVPVLQDLKVRQALVYAINREEITKALFEGKQRAAVHNIAPMDPWFTDDPKKITIYKYSKRDANRLLDEAGWKTGADGYRYKDGKKLSLQFMTTSGQKTRETVQTLLQSQWKSVGVEVIIKNEPARVFFGETTRKRKFEGMALFAWTSAPEQSPRSNLHSSQIPTEKNSWSGQNQPGWSNKKVDEALDKLDLEFNSAKRKELAGQILKEYTAEVPVIPLYYRSEISVTPKNMQGYRLSGHLYHDSNEIEAWNLGSTVK